MADDGFNPISGSKGGGGSQRTPIEAPDSLYSTAMARILDLISEGDIEMWVSDNPLKDTYLDETPVMNADGSLNFQSVQLEYRTGTPDQSYIPGFPSVQSEFAVGVQLQFGTPWVRAVNNIQLSAIKLRLAVQALNKTNNTNGDINGYRVDYAIDISTDGGAYVEVFSSAFAGKTSSLYERTHRVDLPPATTGWNVRVRRLTPDASDAYTNDKTYIQAITEIVDAKMRYPYSAVVGITLDSQQFRSIPRRAYRLKGRIVRVPSNYNPSTRAYTGVWDGTFVLAWTNNPAWIYYDLATNQRYGLGKRVPEARIDKWSLYKIAQYCDELVPDGKGGTEPRFTCTIYLQRAADAYKVMKDLASVFRGISYWAGGAVVALADQPEDPVYTYTNANVKDGKFIYNGTSKKARHTVAMVQYTNVDNFGKGEVEPVIDEEGIIRYGIQETTITAFGCTSQSQAQRVGKWLLLTETLLTDATQFAVGQDGTLVAPGRIVRIIDRDRAGRRLGGRVSAVGANYVIVDAMPDVAPVAGDKLITITPTGTAQESTVLSVDVGLRKITATANFPAAPIVQSVWGLETVAIAAQTFRMLGVTDNQDGSYGMAAVQHNASLFDAVDLGTKVEIKPTSILPSTVQAAPAAVVIASTERAGDVIASVLVNADWEAVPGAAAYYIQWKRGDSEWSPPQKLIGTSADLDNVFPGPLVARVWAVNQAGIASALTLSNKLTIADQSLRPGFVEELETGIADALLTAQNAQAAADGAIVSFWQTTAPVIGSGAGQAKVGDIWFDTDDGNKIYRVVSGAWVLAADDDMAQAILAATNAQATADGKVKTYFSASAPAGPFALGDLWFDTNDKKLYRWDGSAWSQNIADITLEQLAGTGVNQMWDEYARFATGALPDLLANAGAPAPTLDTTRRAVGTGGCLSTVTATANTSEGYYFGTGGLDYNTPLMPGKYIFSFYIHCDTAGHKVRVGGKRNSDATTFGAGADYTVVNANTWERVTATHDLTAQTTMTALLPFIYTNRSGVAGRTVKFDGFMIESQIGTQAAASAWTPGKSGRMAINAIAAAAAALDVADGKIETYFQSTMPAGTLGDLWFDTDDGNKMYRHNGTTYVIAQDTAIGDAIVAAAGAQATADGRVTTFYTASAPTPNAVGDLWYNTTAKDLSRWNGSTWVKVGDITADKLGGNGTNILWQEYSQLTEANASLGPSTNPAVQTSGITLAAVVDAAANGGFSYQATTINTVNTAYTRFALDGADNNIQVGGNRKYLVSYYAKANVAGHQVRPFTRGSGANTDGTVHALTTVRTRYTWVWDASAIAEAAQHFGLFCNTSGVSGRVVTFDGFMIEPMVGNDTAPSQFVAGPSARQTQRAIANAAVAQATADGKIDSFYQASPPGTASEGDIWFDTDDGNKIYTRRSGAWVATPDSQIAAAITAAAGAQATADGKVKTFYQTTTPTAEGAGDLWFNKNTSELKRWSGSAWTINFSAPTSAAAGANLLPNPAFVNNTLGFGVGGTPPINQQITDGWIVSRDNSAWGADVYANWPTSTAGILRCTVNAPAAVPNGTYVAGQARTLDPIPVEPNAKYVFTYSGVASYNGTPVGGVTYASRMVVQWLDSAGAQITAPVAATLGRVTTNFASGEATAPSNAASAHVFLDVLVTNNSGAAWTHNSTVALRFDFKSVSMIRKVDLDEFVDDGTNYGRFSVLDRFSSGGFWRLGLRIGNSGHRIGNQRNLVRSNTSAYGMVRTTTALTATSAGAVSVNAHTARYGGYSVAYNAVANAITGLTVGTSYVIYCSDPDLTGGTKTYFATTNPDAAMNISDDIYVVGQITIPSSGSSSGGGGGGGGDPGDWCVDADMLLPDGRRAGDIRAGDTILCWDGNAENPGIVELVVQANVIVPGQPSTEIVTESGALVVASDSTPMTLRDGRVVLMPEMAEEDALVLQSGHAPRWEPVVTVRQVEPRTVAKLTVHQQCYFAGMYPGLTVATHNAIHKP